MMRHMCSLDMNLALKLLGTVALVCPFQLANCRHQYKLTIFN
ncbi:hypothetical protein OIU74_016561 [Salix koriyanagi]|uniref:Uncharacterized protein n=2 Tax=Salix TaxID=40685 RepID=A0A9Q0PGM9_9ROSI|nr:hypothetical protein OIU74_016561 [Salix koriyanagi]